MNKLWGEKISPWWNVLEEQLVLGALPLKAQKDLLQNLQTKAVLSLVEEFELEGLPICPKPISKQDWKQGKIAHLHLPVPDMKGLSIEEFEKGIEFIEQEQAKGKRVYVHCKAGRGRSASMVAAYYIKKYQLKPQEALSKLRKQRPLSAPNQSQIRAIENFYEKSRS